jgi:hypothetical protein
MRPIYKCSPETDLYMEWSTVSEGPTFIGSRQEMIEYLNSESRWPGEAEERLVRTDATGSSWRFPEGDTGLVYLQIGWLPRERYLEFARLVQAGAEPESDEVLALLKPLEEIP